MKSNYQIQKEHLFINTYGCPVHHFGYSEKDRICSCREYWAKEEEVSPKAWREDHDIHVCREANGACTCKEEEKFGVQLRNGDIFYFDLAEDAIAFANKTDWIIFLRGTNPINAFGII